MKLAAALVIGSVGLAAGADTQIFFTDFNAGIPWEFSGHYINESVQGFAGAGHPGNTFGGNFLRNDAIGNPATPTVLTLTGLPTHTYINVGFLVALIESWDSDNGSCCSPDYFNVAVDGTPIVSLTTNIALGSNSYAGDLIWDSGNAGWGSYNDRAWDMGSEPLLQNIPHSDSTLVLSFYASGVGWQGGGDESWAIDNLGITGDFVPAPGALALAGVGGLIGARRRR